jgi:hypothetical protein
MRRRITAGGLVVLALALAPAARGVGEPEGEAGRERAAAACSGSPLATVKLPAPFPKPAEVVYTDAETAGPTELVDGYYEGNVRDAYEAYKSGFEDAGYDILPFEVEEHDAEVSYGGANRTGQVMRNNCREDGRISLHSPAVRRSRPREPKGRRPLTV